MHVFFACKLALYCNCYIKKEKEKCDKKRDKFYVNIVIDVERRKTVIVYMLCIIGLSSEHGENMGLNKVF